MQDNLVRLKKFTCMWCVYIYIMICEIISIQCKNSSSGFCKLPTNGKQLPVFPLEAMPGTEPRPQRWEARVLPLCLRGQSNLP